MAMLLLSGFTQSLGHVPNRIAPGVKVVGKVGSWDKEAGAIVL